MRLSDSLSSYLRKQQQGFTREASQAAQGIRDGIQIMKQVGVAEGTTMCASKFWRSNNFFGPKLLAAVAIAGLLRGEELVQFYKDTHALVSRIPQPGLNTMLRVNASVSEKLKQTLHLAGSGDSSAIVDSISDPQQRELLESFLSEPEARHQKSAFISGPDL